MAVLQYIGARYVPKVFNDGQGGMEWKANTYYEPLTIVTYNNTSYISRGPVAASVGNPAVNGAYWAETGNYNAYVKELAESIEEVRASVGNLSDNADTAFWRNKPNHIVLIGDSWADYASDPSNVMIPQVLQEMSGAEVHNYAHGGTGFDVPNGYDAQISMVDEDTSYDHSKMNCVVLIAGLNEYNSGTDATTFIQKLKDWIGKWRARYDCPIYWFYNYSVQNQILEDRYNTTYYAQKAYFDYIASHVGSVITCINLQGSVTFDYVKNNWNTANWYHPNSEGSIEVAHNIWRAIMGEPLEMHNYFYARGVWTNSENQNLARTDAEFYVQDGVLKCRFITPVYATLGQQGAQTITWNRPIPATFNDYAMLNPYCYMDDGGGSWRVVPYSALAGTAKSGSAITDGVHCAKFPSDP